MNVHGGCKAGMEQSSAFFGHCILIWAEQGQNVRKEIQGFSMIDVTGWQVVQTGFTWMFSKSIVDECNHFFINLID